VGADLQQERPEAMQVGSGGISGGGRVPLTVANTS
jgi:hypothetical protein